MTEVNLPRSEMVGFYRGFDAALADKGLKSDDIQRFIYAVSKMKRRLKPEYEAIVEAESALLRPYYEEADEVGKKYAAKNDAGKLEMSSMGRYKIDDSMLSEYVSEMKALEKKYAKELEQNKGFLAESIKIEVHTVPDAVFPKEFADNRIADALFWMREEESRKE
jgi:hypothetical protein